MLYSVVLLAAMFLVWKYREHKAHKPLIATGKTMGTTYHITYFDAQKRDLTKAIDSLLVVVNKSINNYDPNSEVSRFNAATRSYSYELPYFLPPILKSKEVYEQSHGAFDPTVMPLVNAWGFGSAKAMNPDSAQVDSLKALVGFDKIHFDKDSIWKTNYQAQLDFGGIGQGYGADVVADFLKSKGIVNALVELGGEGLAMGVNESSGRPWQVGILDPNSTYENQFFIATVDLENRSFTTSGNYFNYREVNGVKYSHTIDPVSGYPSRREILSASVFAKDAITADAWGTAFMEMGHEKAIEILKDHKELDAFLIFSSKDGIGTYITDGIKPNLKFSTQ